MHTVNCTFVLLVRYCIVILIIIIMIVSHSSKAMMLPFTTNIVTIVGTCRNSFGIRNVSVLSMKLHHESSILRRTSSTVPTKPAFVQQQQQSRCSTRVTTVVNCQQYSQLNNNNNNNNENDSNTLPVETIQYVFGYGSLICSNSRSMTTTTTKKNDDKSMMTTVLDTIQIPVQVFGMKRIWCKRSIRGMTSMGIVFANNNNDTTNDNILDSIKDNSSTTGSSSTVVGGVLVPVTDNELQLYDIREVGYTRYPIPIETIQLVPYLSYNESNTINNDDDTNLMHQKYYYYYNTINLLQSLNNSNSNSNSNNMNNSNNNDKRLTTCTDTTTTSSTTTTTTTILLSESNTYNKSFITNSTTLMSIKKKYPITTINVWVYIPNEIQLPTYNYPIVQSYLDTILRGCITIHEQFAIDYILSTYGWYDCNCTTGSDANLNATISHYWINDRTNPIYPRGDVQWSNIYGTKIVDPLLQQYIPEYYKNRITIP